MNLITKVMLSNASTPAFVPSADGFDRVEVKREEVIVPIVKTDGKK